MMSRLPALVFASLLTTGALAADAQSFGVSPATDYPTGTLIAGTEIRIAGQLLRTAIFPALADELELSIADSEKLIKLLVENQQNLERAARLSVGVNDQPARDPIQEGLRRQQELGRQQEESIAELLGATKYARWQYYQQTIRSRLEAMSLGAQLANVGQPLSNRQYKTLTTAMITAQEQARDHRETLARRAPPMDARALGRHLQAETGKIQEERNRHILDSVRSSLDAQQLETLRKQLELQVATD